MQTSSETIILLKNETKTIKFNGIKYVFILNNNNSILIKDNKKTEIENIPDSKENIDKIFCGKKISLLPQKKIEADGIFNINGFDSSIFNSNEITKIFSNVGDGKKDFNRAILEVKLSRTKIYELIKQIKNDDNIFGRILKKNNLFRIY